MTVNELITELLQLPQDWEIYVDNPSRTQDYFVDGIQADAKQEQVFIQTAD
jgi:hypothetical protein